MEQPTAATTPSTSNQPNQFAHFFFSPYEPPPPFSPQPTDSAALERINVFIKFASQNGPSFVEMVKTKQKDNPDYNFLIGGEYFGYYRWALYCIMFGLPVDVPPKVSIPMQHPAYHPMVHPGLPYAAAMNFQPPITQTLPVSHQQHAHVTPQAVNSIPPDVESGFKQILESLTGSKDSIKSSQAWFMGSAQHAAGMALIMARRLVELQDYDKQQHIIYLANDILFKSLAQKAVDPNADNIIRAFQPVLGVMLCACFATAGRTEEVRVRLQKVLQFWGDKSVYDAATITGFEQAMMEQIEPSAALERAMVAMAEKQNAAAAAAQAAAAQAAAAQAAAAQAAAAQVAAAQAAAAAAAVPVQHTPAPQFMLPPHAMPPSAGPPGQGTETPGAVPSPSPGAYPPPPMHAGQWPGPPQMVPPGGPHPHWPHPSSYPPPGAMPGMPPGPWGVPPPGQGFTQPPAGAWYPPPHMPPPGPPGAPGMFPPPPHAPNAAVPQPPSAPSPMTSGAPPFVPPPPPQHPSARPVSSMSFPPGLLPTLVKEKSRSEPPYSPLSPLDIERAGLPPPPERDPYLRSRLDRFYADIGEYKPGLTRADLESASTTGHNSRDRDRDRSTPSSHGRDRDRDRERERDDDWGGSRRSKRPGFERDVSADPDTGMFADGSFAGGGGQYAGLGASSRQRDEYDEGRGGLGSGGGDGQGTGSFDDMYGAYRRIRSGAYHDMILRGVMSSTTQRR